MPNTLAHLGLHGISTRFLIKNSDFKWIYLACLIPDMPWIFQRFLKVFTEFNPFDTRIYTMIQASLLFCVVLSASLSFLSQNSKKTFSILSLGSLFHLLIDAAQYKWANGVHLFAPFSWELTNYGFFWPSDWLTIAISLLGLGYYIYNWKLYKTFSFDLHFNKKKIFGFISFGIIYLILPLQLLQFPYEANNHFVKTLSEKENRTGKYIEIDRCSFDPIEKKLINFTKEDFYTYNLNIDEKCSLSIKGKFINRNSIEIADYKINNQLVRDYSSFIGLFLLVLIWVLSFWHKIKERQL